MDIRNGKVRLWYLSGGMTKFGTDNFDESNNWRVDVKEQIRNCSDGYIVCFSPNEHWNMMDDPEEFTEREAMNLDIYKLRQSELVIFNNNDPFSRGSMIELGIAYERQIPIFTLNEDNNEVHPWIRDISQKVFTDREDMMMYLSAHYIGRD